MAIYEAQLPATTRMHGWLRFAINVFVILGVDLGYIFEILIKLACSQQKKCQFFSGERVFHLINYFLKKLNGISHLNNRHTYVLSGSKSLIARDAHA